VTPAPTSKPWLSILGLVALVGVAAVVVNLAGKKAYDLLQNGS
jgi:hypothetical protein